MKNFKSITIGSFLSLMIISSAFILLRCGDDDPVVVPTDYTALLLKITEAELLISSTEEGTAQGQYQRGSQAELQTSIDLSKVVAADVDATQTAVDNSVIALDVAVTDYEGKIVVPIDPDNLVGHWAFDEGTGTTVADHSGNDFTGEFKAGHSNWGGGEAPEWVTDRYGSESKALHFDEGANVEIPYSPTLNPTELSISLWVKHDDIDPIWANNYMVAMNRWNGYKVQLQGANKVFFTVKVDVEGSDDPTIYDRDNESPSLNPGEWWHVVVTFGGGNMTFYLDGTEVKQWTDTPGTGFSLGAAPLNLVFGQDLPTDVYTDTEDDFFVGWGGYFIGTMDEIRIYKSVLSASQVESIFELEKP